MTSKTLKHGLHVLLLIAIVLGCLGTFALAAMQFGFQTLNRWQSYSDIGTMKAPGKGDSVVVFAPHSDDETLGCGGMLALAKQNGAKVRVVMMTNGDGFRFAAARNYKTVNVTPEKMISLAYQRQIESLKALREFGVAAPEATFLGYPDRGLATMWETDWNPSEPYTSPATKWNYVGYYNAPSKNAPYCGESVMRDIEKILRTNKPNILFVPHPMDNHPDHYSTYCFVTGALEQLASEGYDFAKSTKVYTYLVHRGDWPTSGNGRKMTVLMPPHSLAQGDTQWHVLPLPDHVVKAKRAAIMCYKSQTNLEKSFLLKFARPNELFGTVQTGIAAAVPRGYISQLKEQANWRGIIPAANDPVGDYFMAEVSKGGDVRAIYACSDGRLLCLRVDFAASMSRRINYTVSIKNPDAPDYSQPYEISIKKLSRTDPDGMMWSYKKNSLQLVVPLVRLGTGNSLYVQVYTKLSNLTVDNTGWRNILLKPAS